MRNQIADAQHEQLEKRFNEAFAPYVGKNITQTVMARIEHELRGVLDMLVHDGILAPDTPTLKLYPVVDIDKEHGTINISAEYRRKLRNH